MKELPHRTYTEMMKLIRELDEALRDTTQPGTVYSLYIIGGFAMGALFDHRFTQDVDVATAEVPAEVLAAAGVVAENHNMPTNWVNNQAAEFIDLDLPVDAFNVLYAGECLLLRGAKPEVLLAMKLMSGRGKDLQDIIDLAENVRIDEHDSLIRLCEDVYADTPSFQVERLWVESVCGDVAGLLKEKRAGSDIATDVAALARRYDGETEEPLDDDLS